VINRVQLPLTAAEFRKRLFLRHFCPADGGLQQVSKSTTGMT